MLPSDQGSTDPQVTVFSVPARAVMVKRASEIALGVYGLMMIAVFFPWNGPPPPDSIAHIVWPILAVGTAAPAAFVWFRWKRIPPGAPGGTLRIGQEGIEYRVGPDHIRLTWAQIAAAYPITRPPKTRILAVWLPSDDPDPPNSSRRTLLEIAHLKSPYRPVEQKDGVVLPLQLFGNGQEKADEIIATLRRRLEAQGRKA
ncbi:MAG: hypothetical protein C0427_01325 [Rhodobacter sp.]|nr:hypothetical protein [Rhodobacter sp.]